MRIKTCALTILLILSLSAPVLAQDRGVVGRISNWAIERAAWGDFESFVTTKVAPILDAKLNDGTLVDWGFTRRALHVPEQSHSLWTVARTQGGLLKADEAVNEALAGMASEMAGILGATISHSDSMVRSNPYMAKATRIDGGYLIVSTVTVQHGQEQAFGEWWGQTINPVFKGLFDSGVVLSYGLDEDEYVSTPRSRTAWAIVADADGVDRYQAGFGRAFGSMSPAESRGTFEHLMRDILEPDSFNSYISKILHYRAKP